MTATAYANIVIGVSKEEIGRAAGRGRVEISVVAVSFKKKKEYDRR